ncbi:hypothetical protein [Kitasatospora cinereorecta]|uniref:Uncharacterized protein n=1 Tax=Kitasatospora cinereorecta TaxID=285560 RepID=A0ABW0VCS1_9ACTN
MLTWTGNRPSLPFGELPRDATYLLPAARAALLAVSALVPLTISPAAAAGTGPARSASAPAAASHRPDDDCPPGGFSPEVTAKLDAAIDQVRQETGPPGVIVGLWMPSQGTYVRATGVADKATDRPMSTDLFMRIGTPEHVYDLPAQG